MKSITHDQKIAFLAIPVLLFGMLGANYALGYESSLTEEQKTAVIEAFELRQAGNIDAARKVLSEAGVIEKFPSHGPSGVMHEKREAIRAAVEAKDYGAFVKATKGTLFGDTVTKEGFDTIVEAHELRESGDFEGAHALLEKAGISQPFGMSGRQHDGFGKGGGMMGGMHGGF